MAVTDSAKRGADLPGDLLGLGAVAGQVDRAVARLLFDHHAPWFFPGERGEHAEEGSGGGEQTGSTSSGHRAW